MLWFISFVVAAILMSLSDKAWGNPLAFLGVGYLGLCFALMGSVALKAFGLGRWGLSPTPASSRS